jgi:hypothetical protein
MISNAVLSAHVAGTGLIGRMTVQILDRSMEALQY